tara:strand:+ start:1405 stop:1812 length:408 start_codon:yes stop_codon:yes gene_type:complete
MKNALTKADKSAIEEAGQLITDQQRMFIDNLFIPGITQKQAAISAGYAEKSAHVAASRILRYPKVMDYLDACVNHGMKLSAIRAAQVVVELSESANSPYVRLQAAQDTLDRAGHKPIDRSMVAVKGELNVTIDLS